MNLKTLAEWCLQENYYSYDEILRTPYLTVQILNNKLHIIRAEYIENNVMEQRQYSICKMLENLCKNYSIPNVILSYCTHDKTPDLHGSFFTHARLRSVKTKNILAPCFTFYGYPERIPSVITKYEQSWNNLLENKSEWKNKNNELIFVGSITDNNYRKINTTLQNSPVPFRLQNQGADSSSFVSREYLNQFKYLLHLNGNAGAYASRLKYLLGCNSLVFYNCNSGVETNFWQEWWMHENYFIDNFHYIKCSNINEFENKLKFFYDNDIEAQTIAKNGFEFFKEHLNPEKIYEFWNALLVEYKSRCLFEIDKPLGNIFKENSYGD